jgi:hypothetical protein
MCKSGAKSLGPLQPFLKKYIALSDGYDELADMPQKDFLCK